MAVNFLKDEIQEVARSLPDLMTEVDTNYRFKEKKFSYETNDHGENLGGIAKYQVKIPDEEIPYQREDLQRVFGAPVTLQIWSLLSEELDQEVDRRAQLYTGASNTTPREYEEKESERLHELLTTDLETVMEPEPDNVKHIEENGSEIYEWEEK